MNKLNCLIAPLILQTILCIKPIHSAEEVWTMDVSGLDINDLDVGNDGALAVIVDRFNYIHWFDNGGNLIRIVEYNDV